MPSLKHRHTYKRWQRRGVSQEMWFKCADPKCTHIAPKSLIKGKESSCGKCGGAVIMDSEQFKRSIATCLDCQDSTKGRDYRARRDMAKGLVQLLVEEMVEEPEERQGFDEEGGLL